jgi:hypothetical protein
MTSSLVRPLPPSTAATFANPSRCDAVEGRHRQNEFIHFFAERIGPSSCQVRDARREWNMKDVIAEMDRLKREKEPKQNASSALLNYDIFLESPFSPPAVNEKPARHTPILHHPRSCLRFAPPWRSERKTLYRCQPFSRNPELSNSFTVQSQSFLASSLSFAWPISPPAFGS